MNKRIILITGIALTLIACANNGNTPNNNSLTTYDNQPDSPTVNSRAASSEEFPEENQLTPKN